MKANDPSSLNIGYKTNFFFSFFFLLKTSSLSPYFFCLLYLSIKVGAGAPPCLSLPPQAALCLPQQSVEVQGVKLALDRSWVEILPV